MKKITIKIMIVMIAAAATSGCSVFKNLPIPPAVTNAPPIVTNAPPPVVTNPPPPIVHGDRTLNKRFILWSVPGCFEKYDQDKFLDAIDAAGFAGTEIEDVFNTPARAKAAESLIAKAALRNLQVIVSFNWNTLGVKQRSLAQCAEHDRIVEGWRATYSNVIYKPVAEGNSSKGGSQYGKAKQAATQARVIFKGRMIYNVESGDTSAPSGWQFAEKHISGTSAIPSFPGGKPWRQIVATDHTTAILIRGGRLTTEDAEVTEDGFELRELTGGHKFSGHIKPEVAAAFMRDGLGKGADVVEIWFLGLDECGYIDTAAIKAAGEAAKQFIGSN